MVIERKLNDEARKAVALELLCGLAVEDVSNRWQVCTHTARKTLDYVRQFNDPLLNFFLSREGHQRFLNGTHFYLGFAGKAVTYKNLIQPDNLHHQRVHDDLETTYFKPAINQTILIGLEEFMSPSNGYERLLCDVFNGDNSWKVNEIFIDTLYKDYGNSPFSLEKVSKETRAKVIEKIKHGQMNMTPIKLGIFQDVLKTLTEREQAILSKRYGLEGDGNTHTLSEIGQEYLVGGERIRGIQNMALLKLRHPTRLNSLKMVYGFFTDSEIVDHFSKQKLKKELYPQIRTEVMQELLNNPNITELIAQYKDNSSIYTRRIDHLELSVRTLNCLNNADIPTIGKLVNMTEAQLSRYRNLGKKSLREVKDRLAELGLSLSINSAD